MPGKRANITNGFADKKSSAARFRDTGDSFLPYHFSGRSTPVMIAIPQAWVYTPSLLLPLARQAALATTSIGLLPWDAAYSDVVLNIFGIANTKEAAKG